MNKVGDIQPPPASIDLLGIEPLEEHARRLAALFTVSLRRRGSTAHLKALRRHTLTLRKVYRSLAADVGRGEPSSPAADWLLDNFHIVLAAVRDIHHDLPASPAPVDCR
jgi:cyclic beta-1,2-glucan synthetase